MLIFRKKKTIKKSEKATARQPAQRKVKRCAFFLPMIILTNAAFYDTLLSGERWSLLFINIKDHIKQDKIRGEREKIRLREKNKSSPAAKATKEIF